MQVLTSLKKLTNKGYYIPSEEEFCVGFEYEVLQNFNTQGEMVPTWEKRVLTVESIIEGDLCKIFQDLDKRLNSVRCKYLRFEDFKRLGFVFHRGLKQYVSVENEIVISFEAKQQIIQVSKVNLATKDSTIVHMGVCKNFTELWNILKYWGKGT